jgi:hypothetical protein
MVAPPKNKEKIIVEKLPVRIGIMNAVPDRSPWSLALDN